MDLWDNYNWKTTAREAVAVVIVAFLAGLGWNLAALLFKHTVGG